VCAREKSAKAFKKKTRSFSLSNNKMHENQKRSSAVQLVAGQGKSDLGGGGVATNDSSSSS
jgi:hypothetical protein